MVADLELCFGTIYHADFAQLIDAAAFAGFDAITVTPGMVEASGLSGPAARALLRDAGVRVTNIDGFGSGLPGIPSGDDLLKYASYGGRDVRPTFTVPEDAFFRAAELVGSGSINMMHFGGDPLTPFDALVESTGAICRRAASHGLKIVFEFLPFTAIASIGETARLIAATGEDNLGIMFDTRHLARTGGAVEDVCNHVRLIGAVQVSDLFWETREDPNRLLPGEGELPLAAMVAPIRAAHPDLPIGIEVFSDRLDAMSPREAAVAAVDSLKQLMQTIDQPARA